MSKPKPTPRARRKETLDISYAAATYRTSGGSGYDPFERQRYTIGRTESGFAVFDLMNGNLQVAGPFGTRRDAEDWTRKTAVP
jgi:hypothetical protein